MSCGFRAQAMGDRVAVIHETEHGTSVFEMMATDAAELVAQLARALAQALPVGQAPR